MRTRERLKGLKEWLHGNLCAGREMKVPKDDIKEIALEEPRVYLAYYPTRPDQAEGALPDPASTCPSILVMPVLSPAKSMEEKRFDRYNDIHRPKDLGQVLAVNMLFSVYEPGIRLPGFADSGDIRLIREGTEEGLFTLYDWMDDCRDKLLGAKSITGTDLHVNEESMVVSMYTDQNFVVDKRPLFYGFVNVEFYCYADERTDPRVHDLLN